MIQLRIVAIAALIGVLAAVVTTTGTVLTDPYEILKRHFAANGGLDRLKAERTGYSEGNLAIAGLMGSLKVWAQKPDRSRAEVDLGVLKMIQADNGEFQWILDSNGKLQKITKLDEASIKRKQIKLAMDEYEYVNPKSDLFTVALTGVEKVQDRERSSVSWRLEGVEIEVHAVVVGS